MKLPLFIASTALTSAVLAADAADWRSRSIYQLLTDRFARRDGSTTAACVTEDRRYCGGTFQGIINQLDYIQGMGFTAIWISPVTHQLEGITPYGEAYHGYWQQDLYKLNSHFGSPDDLRELAEELHRRDMYLMLDVVVNHNGWNGAASTVNYRVFHPFDKKEYYHNYCPIVDWSNKTQVEDCWIGDNLVSCPDLYTQHPHVRQEYQLWISDLVRNYSVDGLRIDTAREVENDFLFGFVSASGVFATGEVMVNNANEACPYQPYLGSFLNYPAYYSLIDAFKSPSGNISSLVNQINQVKSTCMDSTVLGSFSENHDNPRFANYTADMSLAKNIIAFTMLADGIPIIYAGQEQHYSGGNDPNNREALWLSGYDTSAPLYQHVAQLNRLRSHAARQSPTYLTYKNQPIYSDSTTLAMRKGVNGQQVITVLSNRGTSGPKYVLSLGNTGYQRGQKLVEVLTCTPVTVDDNGNVPVQMEQGLPRVFYPRHQLRGSRLCDL